MNNIVKILCIAILCLFICACTKFLDVGDPPDKVAANFVYSSNSGAAGVLTGVFFDLQRQGEGFAQGRTGISLFCGLAADEFNALPISSFNDMYTNTYPYDFWSVYYKFIYRINIALEAIGFSEKLSPDVKKHLLGEAYFLRGFIYFYLVNMYGDVPLLLTGDYKLNSKAARVDRNKVYDQIIKDLLDAETFLSSNYLEANVRNISIDRVRPNKFSAKAMLARVYLYKQDWINAELKSTEVLSQKSYYDTVALNEVFAKNSKESIWQLQPVSDGIRLNTLDAEMFTLINGKPDQYFNPVWVSDFLNHAFEIDDQRKNKWLGIAQDTSTKTEYLYISKYKYYSRNDVSKEYLTVLRVAEQYLIRAESRVHLNKLSQAKADLDIIRIRAGLKEIQLGSTDRLLNQIYHERQVELFAEWGHRWFDLKRIGEIDQVMTGVSPHKGGTWVSYKQLFPIPLYDLRYNVNLIQNAGYPSN